MRMHDIEVKGEEKERSRREREKWNRNETGITVFFLPMKCIPRE